MAKQAQRQGQKFWGGNQAPISRWQWSGFVLDCTWTSSGQEGAINRCVAGCGRGLSGVLEEGLSSGDQQDRGSEARRGRVGCGQGEARETRGDKDQEAWTWTLF